MIRWEKWTPLQSWRKMSLVCHENATKRKRYFERDPSAFVWIEMFFFNYLLFFFWDFILYYIMFLFIYDISFFFLTHSTKHAEDTQSAGLHSVHWHGVCQQCR
jgi:hypothetical protein